MIDPLTETDWGKLQKRLEMCRERKVSFDISVMTAERIFAYIEDLKVGAGGAKQSIPAMQGHLDQAAAERDAARDRADQLQQTLTKVRAEVWPDTADDMKLAAFDRLSAQFYPEGTP